MPGTIQYTISMPRFLRTTLLPRLSQQFAYMIVSIITQRRHLSGFNFIEVIQQLKHEKRSKIDRCRT